MIPMNKINFKFSHMYYYIYVYNSYIYVIKQHGVCCLSTKNQYSNYSNVTTTCDNRRRLRCKVDIISNIAKSILENPFVRSYIASYVFIK